jgi:hypothetical protein
MNRQTMTALSGEPTLMICDTLGMGEMDVWRATISADSATREHG